MTQKTEGTQIIEHDWDRIKNTTDKYKVSKMSEEIFEYEIKRNRNLSEVKILTNKKLLK